jgi:hypothetical protein
VVGSCGSSGQKEEKTITKPEPNSSIYSSEIQYLKVFGHKINIKKRVPISTAIQENGLKNIHLYSI